MTSKEEEYIQDLLRRQEDLQRALEASKQELSRYKESLDVIKQEALLAQKDEHIQEQDKRLAEQDEKIAKLTKEVSYLKRRLFGSSSEKHIPKNPEARIQDLHNGSYELASEKESIDAVTQEINTMRLHQQARKSSKDIKPDKEARFKDITEEVIHYYPDDYERLKEEEDWIELTPEESYTIKRIPEKYVKVRHIRYRLMKKVGESIEYREGDKPKRIFANSYTTPSLLAHLMEMKYMHHLPYYRQINLIKKGGLTLAKSTINDWHERVSELLHKAYIAHMKRVISTDYIQCDETTIPVVNNEKHKTKKGYMWQIRAINEKWPLYYYDSGKRNKKVVTELLKNFRGVLQTDGYAAYEQYEEKEGVLLVGCWAHCRRKWEIALEEDYAKASKALEYISALYTIERECKELEYTPEKIAAERTRLAYPIMQQFEIWFKKEGQSVLKGGKIESAIKYTHNQYQRLTRYHLRGDINIDNNAVERGMRPLKIGVKNYLFCQTDLAATYAAIIYTMVGLCQDHGVDFTQWLTYYLDHVGELEKKQATNEEYLQLLPDRYKRD